MTHERHRRAAAVAFLLLSLVFAAGEGAALATHSSSTIGLFAIDANAEGNAATSLGPIDGCSRVETGGEINVDYVVDSIPQDRPMIGFEAEIRYDPQLLEVVAVDSDLLLAAVGVYSPYSGLSDELPDSDGNLRLSVLDAASAPDPEANVERGPGVLARITFRAKSTGVSEVAIAIQEDPQIYPLVQDTKNETIFGDRLGSASLAIGQDCPVEAAEPKIIDLAEINEKIRIQQAQSSPTLIGDNGSPPDGATPEGQTASPSPITMVPCAVTPIPSLSATPDASLSPSPSSPAADAQTPETPASTSIETPVASPTPTDVLCTPTPTPVQDEIRDVEDDSDTVLIGGAAVLLVLGAATAGGGWYLYRRSRNSSPV